MTIVSASFAQVVNLNPDPDGTPWIAGPQPELTPEILSTLTEHNMSDAAMAVLLPPSWDNSELPVDFFPDIINQTYNSCEQVAGVRYTLMLQVSKYHFNFCNLVSELG